MKLREVEKLKKKKNAVMSDGYGYGISLGHGIVVGAESGNIANDLISHGVVMPWGDNPHVKILVCKE